MNDNHTFTIAFHTIGCKLNFSESSFLARQFNADKYIRVDFNQKADIYIINTCTVTGNADKKCRQAIRKAIKKAPDAIIAVVGCYSQLKYDEIANIPVVALILGTEDKYNLYDYIDKFEKKAKPEIICNNPNEFCHFTPAYSLEERTRSFLKIQDGCDYHCAYCTVPYARGKSRSDTIKNVIEKVNVIATNGFKEIVLTGVNIGDFGKNNNETLLELITQLENINGIERFRLSSIEPDLLSEQIIEFIADSKKFAHHFHVPLQSGCNKILSLMHRKYSIEDFTKKYSKIIGLLPDVFIGMDIITGFPGETNNDFLETYNFLKNIEVSNLHVFSFSKRKYTIASMFPEMIQKNEIYKRSQILHKLAKEKYLSFLKKNIGSNATVLFETRQNNGKIIGFTGNYIPVEIVYDAKLINNMIKVRLSSISKNGNMKCSLI
ncbi:MAG: tRNA (N(6)-L-threonylcarbamoyladenosine(37)-C(2))-methylthiotransferase MtaB [Bacteroidia bacterium]|nr:tRNA (N(6)-L-threonylcarbamoyladenosine(37)-C(2))-methylthiotransferase MtaB [Bacteroidia bacterium]